MATHSSILAWKVPWTEEPGRWLQSMGSHRVGHNWSNLAAAAARDPHNFNTWSKSTHSEQVHSSIFYYFHLLKQVSSISLTTSIFWQSLALCILEFLKDVRIYQTQHFSSLPNGQRGTNWVAFCLFVCGFVFLWFLLSRHYSVKTNILI